MLISIIYFRKFGWGRGYRINILCSIFMKRWGDLIWSVGRKITLGITALLFLRVPIDEVVCDLDVGLGCYHWRSSWWSWSVRPVESYMI